MGAISKAKVTYGLSATGTPVGTNVAGSNTIGSTSITLSPDANIAYSFKVTSAAAANKVSLALDTGVVTTSVGSPTVVDGDGKDFEGVTLGTAVNILGLLIKGVTMPDNVTIDFVTSDFGGSPTIELVGVSELLWRTTLAATSGTMDITFAAGATVLEVIVLAETA